MGQSISREIPNQADWKDRYRSCAENLKTREVFRFKFACTWISLARGTRDVLTIDLDRDEAEKGADLPPRSIIYHASSHKVEDRLHRRLHHNHQGDG